MIRSVRQGLVAAGFCLLAAAPAAAQTGVMADLVADVEEVKGKIVGLAKAMPEAAFDWRPSAGQLEHQTRLAETGIGDDYKTVEAFEKRARTRAEVIAELEKSFAFLDQQMKAATEASLATPSKWPKMTKQRLWIATATHLHEHLGQLIAYARSNTVTPPWSK